MNGRRVSYVFLFFAVAISVVAGKSDFLEEVSITSGEVSIWYTTVTLTCPFSPANDEETVTVKWHKDKTFLFEGKTYTIENYNNKNDGLYYCSQDKDKHIPPHYFLIKATVCKYCIDLDMKWALLVVFADMFFTLGIVFLVYCCTHKKAGTATPQRSTEARHPRPQARGPPPPDPDYQPLNQATRSNDVYSTANRR